ncbi:MAG: TraB/GumN family protein [Yoonia sp.]|nr:TraB/GumN family protein [Yoonia sp.]
MLRKIFAIFCFCTLTTPVLAFCGGDSYFDHLTSAEQSKLADLTADIAYGQGTIWTATRGADKLTLVGTMHINDPRLRPVIDGLSDVIANADLLLVEATAKEEAQVQAALTSDPTLLFLPDDQTLLDLMDSATWDQLINAARDRDIPPFLMSKFQPWYLMMALAIPPCALVDLAAGKRGLDHMVMDAAMMANVPVRALEPFDTLFRVLQTGTVNEQINTLKLALMPKKDQEAMFVALLDSYFSGDIGRLIALDQIVAERADGRDPATASIRVQRSQQALLYDRNIAWIHVINAATDQHDSIVIAVGAAHLPGDQGVLKLLENGGWNISRR